MSNTLTARLDSVKCQPLKCQPKGGESLLQLTEPQAQLVATALDRAEIPVKAAAADMGISESLLHRQLKGKDHLSWQRLNLLPDRFFAELLVLIAQRRGIGAVTTTVQIARTA